MVDSYFKNILAFAIIMGGSDVMSKSPQYILEKFGKYIGSMGRGLDDAWKGGLDSDNRHFFNLYLKKWFKENPSKPEVTFKPDKPKEEK